MLKVMVIQAAAAGVKQLYFILFKLCLVLDQIMWPVRLMRILRSRETCLLILNPQVSGRAETESWVS